MTEHDVFNFVNRNAPASYPTLEEVVRILDLDNESYPNLGALLISVKLIKRATELETAIRKERRRRLITNRLGVIPTTTEELIDAILSNAGFQIDPASKEPLTWISPIRNARVALEADELVESACYLNRNVLSDQFKASNIAAEVQYLTRNLAEKVRKEIFAKITDTSKASFDWHLMASTCFDSTLPVDLTVAVLQKFIWQVKRRLAGLPVTYHVMPVIYGSQGCGKSVFVSKILDELGSLWTTTDFGRLADNREANLFRNYALFLDEMHKGDRADMDTVKAVITRESFSYRPMGTNTSVLVAQNATFIGASNKLLEQLINDPTGTRRFIQLVFNSKSGPEQFAFVNSLDFTAMWASVDHLAADPSAPFFDDIKALQTANANKSSVGEFAEALVENKGTYRGTSTYATGGETKDMPATVLSRDELFLIYRDWSAAMRKKNALEQAGFFHELRRLHAQEVGFPFIPRKTQKFNGWLYTGPQSVPTQVVSKLNLKAVK